MMMLLEHKPQFISGKQRGRPKKDVDVGVIFHMVKNDATITAVARHLGIHRDTIYSNYTHVIDEARKAHRKAWRVIADARHEELLQKRIQKELAKRAKRKYRQSGLYRGYF